MLKIAHLTSVHARYDNRILFKQCMSLSKNGYETTLIVADGMGNEVFRGCVAIVDVGQKKGLIHRMTVISTRIYHYALSLDAHIYQIHDPELIPIAYLLFKNGKKIIYDIHEDYRTSIAQKKYIWRGIRKLIARGYNTIEAFARKRFTILLAEKYYQEFAPEGVSILNYPIVTQSENSNDSTVARAYEGVTGSSNQEKIRLLYTGNVTEVRGAFNHSKLVDLAGNISVTFVGFCPSWLADRMLDHVENKQAITIIGKDTYIPQTEIKRIYGEKWTAGLAIFPKTPHYEKKELTKFFEYMLNETPIICSDFPLWKELVEKHECGFAISPNDDVQINKVIQNLSSNPSLRAKLGTNGRQAVKENYNWGSQEKKLLFVYQSLSKS